ncbi:methyltransferase, FkbM family [Bradyrhizobium lablabi]|uniref:Methyltransferase, FkbM family n=1 Tax=Bradyrhizobium lablabi TaxID=722472 RepID=A0A1M6TMW2_9BRAD|nr:methyltransferase, FkbM family [Bradyrhizobium lablabi]
MFQSLIRNSAVHLFGLAAKLGVQRLPLFERVFLALYAGYKRYFEAGPIERLQEFIPTGSLVIDVGANVGFFSLRFAQWVGSGGEVIAIEPEARNYETLAAALKREGLSGRVRTLKAVAAATAGSMFLEINQLHPADHKLSRDGTGVAVEAVRLDDLVQDKGGGRPSLVKIDVQGAEMLVLQGAPDILGLAGPALFIELNEEGLQKFGSSVSAILDHLSQYGYEPYWLMRTGPLRKSSPAEIHAKAAGNAYVDVLFLKSPPG